jgi:hypothetical protein
MGIRNHRKTGQTKKNLHGRPEGNELEVKKRRGTLLLQQKWEKTCRNL